MSRSALPAGVSPYSRPRPAGRGRLWTTPASSSSWRRRASSVREIKGIPCRIWLKRVEPASSSRRISGVHRSAKISDATATGQNWPYPFMGQL